MEEVILLVAYDLLGVVEKLHKAEIVHGDLSPEVFFLGDRFVSACEWGGYVMLSSSSCALQSPLCSCSDGAVQHCRFEPGAQI